MSTTILKYAYILKELQRLQDDGINVYYLVGNHDISLLDIRKDYFPKESDKYFPFYIGKDIRLEAGNKKYYFRHGHELEVWLSFHKDIEVYEDFFRLMCKSRIVRKIGSRVWNFFQKRRAVLKLVWFFVSSLFSSKQKTQKDLWRCVNKAADERIIKSKLYKQIDILATSPALNMLLPIARDEVFVFGHTHRPFKATTERNVWNTGSWKKSKKHNYLWQKISRKKSIKNSEPKPNSYITIDETGKATLSYF